MLLIFIASCCLITVAYDVVDNQLSILTHYLESDRKKYIQKNIVKGLYLAILSVFATFYFFFLRRWDNSVLQALAACYVSNDVMGLYLVEKLPTSTKIHHATSGVFLLASATIDFTTSHVGQLLVYYTYISSLSFCVNLYLALRLCFEIQPYWLENLHKFSKWWYLTLCIMNWLTQLHLISSLNIATGLYTTMILLIVADDIILIKWLFKEKTV